MEIVSIKPFMIILLIFCGMMVTKIAIRGKGRETRFGYQNTVDASSFATLQRIPKFGYWSGFD